MDARPTPRAPSRPAVTSHSGNWCAYGCAYTQKRGSHANLRNNCSDPASDRMAVTAGRHAWGTASALAVGASTRSACAIDALKVRLNAKKDRRQTTGQFL